MYNGIYFSSRGKWMELEITVFGEISQTHGGSQPSGTQVPRNLVPSSGLGRHQACNSAYPYMQRKYT